MNTRPRTSRCAMMTGVLCLLALLLSNCFPSVSAQAKNEVVLGGPDSTVSVKSDNNILFSSGGGHIQWTLSGPVVIQIRETLDTAPKDGNISMGEAASYTSKIDNYLEGAHITYHGARILRYGLRNSNVVTDTGGLIGKVDDQNQMTIDFTYDAEASDRNEAYEMSDPIFVHALFYALDNSTTTYRYLGKVELRHVNTIVGLQSFILTSAMVGHITTYTLPAMNYYDYSNSYSGQERTPINRQDLGEYRVFDPMTNSLIVLIVLIIMWVFIFNIPKWMANHYNKKSIFGLRGGLLGLVAINLILYIFSWRFWLLYILGAVFIILSCALGYIIYGRSKLAKDLETTPKVESLATSPAAPLVAPPPQVDEGLDDFDVEEVFYIYKDGRVITHCSIQGCASIMEKDLVGSMLVAIHEFVCSSFRKSGHLDAFQFGDSKVCVLTGNHGHLVIVMTGVEPPFMRDRMSETVQRIEGMYAGIIEDWDGDKAKFHDLNTMIAPLFELKRGVKIKASEEEVLVKSALEFYEGYLRLKVGVLNERKTSITDVAFRLVYERSALRLSHVEPNYQMDGSAALLGVIAPGEKKSLTFYLDPLTCQVTNIDGSATYRDYRGLLQTAYMKRRPAEIVCPIFLTPSTINIAMLKRLKDELPYKDSRVYELDAGLDYRMVYTLAREAVMAHDVKLVKEFFEVSPFLGEAWFYGQAGETQEEMIIKVLIDEGKRVTQIWVASRNLATLAGLIAEMGSVVAKRMQDTLGLLSLPMPSMNAQLKEVLEREKGRLEVFQAEVEAAPV